MCLTISVIYNDFSRSLGSSYNPAVDEINQIVNDFRQRCTDFVKEDGSLRIPNPTIYISPMTDTPQFGDSLGEWRHPKDILIKPCLINDSICFQKVIFHELMHALGDLYDGAVSNGSRYLRNEYWAERRTIKYGTDEILSARIDEKRPCKSYMLDIMEHVRTLSIQKNNQDVFNDRMKADCVYGAVKDELYLKARCPNSALGNLLGELKEHSTGRTYDGYYVEHFNKLLAITNLEKTFVDLANILNRTNDKLMDIDKEISDHKQTVGIFHSSECDKKMRQDLFEYLRPQLKINII